VLKLWLVSLSPFPSFKVGSTPSKFQDPITANIWIHCNSIIIIGFSNHPMKLRSPKAFLFTIIIEDSQVKRANGNNNLSQFRSLAFHLTVLAFLAEVFQAFILPKINPAGVFYLLIPEVHWDCRYCCYGHRRKKWTHLAMQVLGQARSSSVLLASILPCHTAPSFH
jgi:hypothetical protein